MVQRPYWRCTCPLATSPATICLIREIPTPNSRARQRVQQRSMEWDAMNALTTASEGLGSSPAMHNPRGKRATRQPCRGLGWSGLQYPPLRLKHRHVRVRLVKFDPDRVHRHLRLRRLRAAKPKSAAGARRDGRSRAPTLSPLSGVDYANRPPRTSATTVRASVSSPVACRSASDE